MAENAAPGITPLIVAERLTNLAVSFADIVEEEKKQSENVAVAAAPAETPAETPTDTTVADSTPPAVEPAAPETPVAPAAPSTDAAAATDPASGTEAAATDAAAATQTAVTETVAAAEPEAATPAGPPHGLRKHLQANCMSRRPSFRKTKLASRSCRKSSENRYRMS